MKTSVVLTFVILIFSQVSAQNKFHPTGVVLCPFETKVEGSWVDSISSYRVKGEISSAERAAFLSNRIPINWRTIRENELVIMQDQNFFSFLSLSISREINYQLMEGNPNLLVFPVTDTVKSIVTDYQKYLMKRSMDWIVNPFKVYLTESGGKKSMEVWLHVYYQPTHHLQVNTNVKVTEDDIARNNEEPINYQILMEVVKRIATTSVDRINRMR